MKEIRKGGDMRTGKVEAAFRSNAKLAQILWGEASKVALEALKALTARYSVSVAAGDIQLVDGRWFITHAGLLRIGQRNRCAAIRTVVDRRLSDPASSRWVFRATVYKSRRSRGFVGYGDADPSNVAPLVHGAELRVAETRAVNRALRKAYGIGLCSVEELGWALRVADSKPSCFSGSSSTANSGKAYGHHSGQPRLRDRLCLLIRQQGLDANLVKSYAADYCGTSALRDATRDQIEEFINHLAERAAKDRPGLICQLNSYAKSQVAS